MLIRFLAFIGHIPGLILKSGEFQLCSEDFDNFRKFSGNSTNFYKYKKDAPFSYFCERIWQFSSDFGSIRLFSYDFEIIR